MELPGNPGDSLGPATAIQPERPERGENEAPDGAPAPRAVTVLRALDQRICDATDQTRSLDDVSRLLVRDGGTVTTARVQEPAQQVSGQDLSSFFASEVP